jgi:hypothetical protein
MTTLNTLVEELSERILIVVPKRGRDAVTEPDAVILVVRVIGVKDVRVRGGPAWVWRWTGAFGKGFGRGGFAKGHGC